MVVVFTNLIAPAAALAPAAEVDLPTFAARAEAWNAAREAHREEARQLALDLAAEGRQAEADRIAAEEAAREAAALAAARAEAERVAAEEAAVAAAAAGATSTTTTTTTTTTVPAPETSDAATGTGDVPETTVPVAPEPEVVDGPTAAQWEALRLCESDGNYSAVSSSGRYRGAYQFSQATWDWVAGFAAPHLVGFDPAAASPADQDALALALWRVRGWSPWPHCGAGL